MVLHVRPSNHIDRGQTFQGDYSLDATIAGLNTAGWAFAGSMGEGIAVFERTVPAPSPWVTDGVTLPREGTMTVLVSKDGTAHEWDYDDYDGRFGQRGIEATGWYTIDQIDGWMYLPEPVRKETKGEW
jgi:hypothetical protein